MAAKVREVQRVWHLHLEADHGEELVGKLLEAAGSDS